MAGWIEVGRLAEAFEAESYVLPASDGLAGRELVLDLGGGPERRRFDGAWRVTSLREGLYLADRLTDPPGSTSLVLDLTRGLALEVAARLPTEGQAASSLRDRLDGDSLSTVSVAFRRGTIDGVRLDGEHPFQPTRDLVGHHNRYVYGPSERYDHLYLNDRLYTWHCIAGAEAGLADTDRCHHFRLADRLYLFVWQEKIIPTLGLVLIDLAAARTDGKILGWRDAQAREIANFPVGARIEPLGRLGGLGAR